MKHIGIIAITAPGAALCYQTIVSEAEKILGPRSHPPITLHNPPFIDTFSAHERRDWNKVEEVLVRAVKKLAAAGCDFAIMPANATHYAFKAVQKASPIPLISIVDVTVAEAKRLKFTKAAILGVGITMEDSLYVKPLEAAGITPFTPPPDDQIIIKDIIYKELVPNRPTTKGLQIILSLLKKYQKEGCDGALLACTELPMVINEKNSPIPIVDTTRLLAQKALHFSLSF